MDTAALWQRYQDWLYYHPELAFYVDISRMGFDGAFVESLEPKFEKAFADIKDIEAGAIANPDEGRMVGHYWLRNADLAPNAELKADIVDTLEKIEKFTKSVHAGEITAPGGEKFTDILSVGIGGSALGPQFVAQALTANDAPLALSFIDNTDPAGIAHTLDALKDRLNTTLVLVISKSGGTPETRNGMLEVKNFYKAHNIDFSSHAIAITGIGSKLENIAKADHWLTTFPMHDWVGGRTSELSAVGLVAAALQGIDIRAMLDGAKIMDDTTRIASIKENPAALLALAWYYSGNGKGEKDMVILPYKDSLLLFSRYLQQLIMESLGKEEDLDGNKVYQGIAVYGNKGSTDQHAYVQQLREGVPNFFATFIEVLSDGGGEPIQVEPGVTSGDYLSGLLQGTREALFENQRDSVTISIPEVNATTVGAMIALYERAVTIYASLVNINAYHQPGVEAGKKAAASVLDLQKKVVSAITASEMALTLDTLATKVDAVDQIETIYKIVRHLAANGRSVKITGDLAQPSSLKVGRL